MVNSGESAYSWSEFDEVARRRQPLQFAVLIHLVEAEGCHGKHAIEDDFTKLKS